MVQILRLDHLEYREAILDGPEFREKLKKHEKHITDTSKNIKVLLKKLDDVITASESKLICLFHGKFFSNFVIQIFKRNKKFFKFNLLYLSILKRLV